MIHADVPSPATTVNERQAAVISIKHSAMTGTVILIILQYRKPLCPPQINDFCISYQLVLSDSDECCGVCWGPDSLCYTLVICSSRHTLTGAEIDEWRNASPNHVLILVTAHVRRGPARALYMIPSIFADRASITLDFPFGFFWWTGKRFETNLFLSALNDSCCSERWVPRLLRKHPL